MAVNFTNLTGNGTDTFAGIFEFANQQTGGWFGNMAVIGFWVLLFTSMKRYPTNYAFAASTFITAIMTILGVQIGLCSPAIMWISIVASAISGIILIWEK